MKNGAFDYLVKPVRQEQLMEAIGKALRHRAVLIENEELERQNEEYRSKLEKMVEDRTEELKDAYQKLRQTNLETVRVLAETIDAKDPYTRGHSQRVRLLCASTARQSGISPAEIEMLEYSALLHDIGKIGMPEALLHKEGPLERHEVDIFRKHPVVGESILSNVEFFKPCLLAVRQHHERWDGKGYPDGIAGIGISPFARIIAVCDSFDAMISTRPYRQALPVEFALSELEKGEGTQFAPDVVVGFLQSRAYEEAAAAYGIFEALASQFDGHFG
jgi:putative nucleotidyltransferase with HDIG domain